MASEPQSATKQNLEAAFAGESMAHIKYRYFARICRAAGDEASAKVFEDTANQEILHAFGHFELMLTGENMTPTRCLEMALAGETHEYTDMYPQFHAAAVAEAKSNVAADTAAVLEKAAKRFAALAKVEERHAGHYREQLNYIRA